MKIKKRAPKKKEITETEEIQGKIQEFYSIAGQLFQQYRTAAIASIIVIIVLILGGTGYYYLLQKWDREAAELEDKAYALYLAEDFQGAITEYQKILNEYPSAENAAAVLFYIGNSHAAAGQFDEAIQTYQEVIKKYRGDETVIALSYLKLGYVYMDKKDYSGAISAFKEASQLKESFVADRATYEIARAYDISGDKVSAIEQYEKIVKSFPTSPWKQDATSRLNLLTGGSQGEEKEPPQDKTNKEETDKP